jgi:Flp pilus assembly protein TadB
MKAADDVSHSVSRFHTDHRLTVKRTNNKKRIIIATSIVVIIGKTFLLNVNLVISALVLIAVCVCAYFRLQYRKREIKELHAYMKNLVDQVNTSPTSRWKVL